MGNKLKLQNIIKHIKTMFYNLVSGQFNKSQTDTISVIINKKQIDKYYLQLLINCIRKMILRFINSVQENILTTYHIRIDFKTREKKPSFYRLELLAELRTTLECDLLISQLSSQIQEKFFLSNYYTNEIKTSTERKLIETNFNDNLKNHISMKFIFRQWIKTFQEIDPIGWKTISVIDNTIEPNGVKDYRVNILKSGEIAFSSIKDMFCVEIDTTEFTKTDK